MAALGRKADIQPGRMSALTDTGRSEALKQPNLNVRYRPEAGIQLPHCRTSDHAVSDRFSRLYSRLHEKPEVIIRT